MTMLSWLHCNLHLLLVMVTIITHLASSAPLSSTTQEEDPTMATLPEPDTQENVPHEYVADLFRCLKLRDDIRDISSSDHGCVPDVFSTAEDVPSSQVSDTVLNFIATNTIQHTRNLTMTLKVSEQDFLGDLHSIHLRIYKKRMDDDFINEISENCSLFDGLNISLSILTSDDKYIIHYSNLTYEDLLTEKWMDFTSFKDVYNASIHSGTETVLHLELDLQDCHQSLTLNEIGIEMETGREPVLALFAKQQDGREVIEQQLSASIQEHKNHYEKRQTEGSGNEIQVASCGLIIHQISYSHLRLPTYGRFDLNYCSGNCKFPIAPSKATMHSQIASYTNDYGLIINNSDAPAIPLPCCVPVEYSATSFITLKQQSIYRIQTYENISARRCGCR